MGRYLRNRGDMPVMTMMSVHMHASMHARYILACLGPYLSQIGSDRKDRDIYGIGGHAGHDYDVCTCARKHARMLACMHAIFWRAVAHISAKLGRIGKIEISMELGGHPM